MAGKRPPRRNSEHSSERKGKRHHTSTDEPNDDSTEQKAEERVFHGPHPRPTQVTTSDDSGDANATSATSGREYTGTAADTAHLFGPNRHLGDPIDPDYLERFISSSDGLQGSGRYDVKLDGYEAMKKDGRLADMSRWHEPRPKDYVSEDEVEGEEEKSEYFQYYKAYLRILLKERGLEGTSFTKKRMVARLLENDRKKAEEPLVRVKDGQSACHTGAAEAEADEGEDEVLAGPSNPAVTRHIRDAQEARDAELAREVQHAYDASKSGQEQSEEHTVEQPKSYKGKGKGRADR